MNTRHESKNDTRSIAVITQRFDNSLTRAKDRMKIDACRQAVYLLVDYLQTRFRKFIANTASFKLPR